jgi:hypothetical protein
MDEGQIRTWLNDFRSILLDIGKQVDAIAEPDRDADNRARLQARATADGYQKIATAIERGLERGLRDIADAIRASNR